MAREKLIQNEFDLSPESKKVLVIVNLKGNDLKKVQRLGCIKKMTNRRSSDLIW